MKTLLIKISGELFSYHNDKTPAVPTLNKALIESIIIQIKTLSAKHKIGLVLGGGNFFRGALDRDSLDLEKVTAHNIGMLSTMVNGLVLQDMLIKNNVPSAVLSAFSCPKISESISQISIKNAFEQQKCIIFVGGTGNPFFTTDTNAVLRALQVGAQQIWKATKVDGVYESDPLINKDAKFYKKISYAKVLEENISVMDKTAITLAQENNLPIRVFNLFTPDALNKALENPDFGSTITRDAN